MRTPFFVRRFPLCLVVGRSYPLFCGVRNLCTVLEGRKEALEEFEKNFGKCYSKTVRPTSSAYEIIQKYKDRVRSGERLIEEKHVLVGISTREAFFFFFFFILKI